MLSNLHTHTVFCDGKNGPEEIVISAIERGFDTVGFSGHGYTDFDLRYCMTDVAGYCAEIKRLKEKYKNEIQVYLGIEEDAFCLCDRGMFDYIIGSSHYFRIRDSYMPIDSNYDYFKKCLCAFDFDVVEMAEVYYGNFCEYIKNRRPDIIGHFDLITKFDKVDIERFLNNDAYNAVAERYVAEAVSYGCIFEVNTGVISRGYRDFPHPAENLLYIICKNGGKVTLSSDCHDVKNLDFGFDEMRKMLYDIGFRDIFVLHNGNFVKEHL